MGDRRPESPVTHLLLVVKAPTVYLILQSCEAAAFTAAQSLCQLVCGRKHVLNLLLHARVLHQTIRRNGTSPPRIVKQNFETTFFLLIVRLLDCHHAVTPNFHAQQLLSSIQGGLPVSVRRVLRARAHRFVLLK